MVRGAEQVAKRKSRVLLIGGMNVNSSCTVRLTTRIKYLSSSNREQQQQTLLGTVSTGIGIFRTIILSFTESQ